MKFTTKILAAAAAAFVGVVALSAYDARPKLSAGFQAKSGLTKTVTRQGHKAILSIGQCSFSPSYMSEFPHWFLCIHSQQNESCWTC